jgi:hypothetical protein
VQVGEAVEGVDAELEGLHHRGGDVLGLAAHGFGDECGAGEDVGDLLGGDE